MLWWRLCVGSGLKPRAQEMGWPPPSYIRDMLIARRAPFGQNEVLSVMIAFPSANPLKVIAAAVAPVVVKNARRFICGRLPKRRREASHPACAFPPGGSARTLG